MLSLVAAALAELLLPRSGVSGLGTASLEENPIVCLTGKIEAFESEGLRDRAFVDSRSCRQACKSSLFG